MGGMGGMMGGMGGMGGMMGGMGGMGGMMGGMGGMGMGGMGMGGGFFDVEDQLHLGAPDADSPAPAAVATHAPLNVEPADGQTLAEAWDLYFSQTDQQIDEPALRQTLRERMTAHKFSEVSEILQSALRSGYVRPWMYEALGLARRPRRLREPRWSGR